MKHNIIAIFFLTAVLSCKSTQLYKPAGLTKMTEEQLIRNTKNHEFPDFTKVVIKNKKGDIIPLDSLQSIMMDESLVPDYYLNAHGKTTEIVIRKATERDKLLGEKLDAAFKEGPDVKIMESIDCESKKSILSDTYDRDQGMRKEGGMMDPNTDKENLAVIVSLLEHCGMPTLEEVSKKEMSAIWLVLQHAPARYQKKYIPMLEESAERGDIEWGSIALMKDRALMYDEKPQIYGSQVMNNELYELAEPEYVDQRRAKMGLGPLKEYLKYFDIEFNVEQKTK